MNVAALIIGNELLSGKTAEANLLVLARTLRSIGAVLERVVMVRDDLDVIAKEVADLASSHDVLFTSGGVGPTHDDVTIDAIAAAFGVDVVSSVEIEKMLRLYYDERLTDGHLRMARTPAGARLVITELMPWPTIVMRNVWILPGVPEIFAMKMAVVAADLGSGESFHTLSVYTNLDEGDLKPHLDHVVVAHPNVEVGSYPKWRHPKYKTLVTFDARSKSQVESARALLIERLSSDDIVEI